MRSSPAFLLTRSKPGRDPRNLWLHSFTTATARRRESGVSIGPPANQSPGLDSAGGLHIVGQEGVALGVSDPIESDLDRDLPEGQRRRRAVHRRIFREMIRQEAESAPVSRKARRQLTRFALRLNIDAFEARLLIRAVEYELGHVPPAKMADIDTPADLDYVVEPEPWTAWYRFLLGFLLAFAAVGLGLWLAGRHSQ